MMFSWENDDVLGWLRKVGDTLKQKDVVANILSEYGVKVNQATISRKVPKAEPQRLNVM